jgi:hypothetical protein
MNAYWRCHEHGCLLGCSAVYSGRSYQRIALMMEAASTSETFVNFYQTTRCYNPEDSHLRITTVRISDPTWRCHVCPSVRSSSKLLNRFPITFCIGVQAYTKILDENLILISMGICKQTTLSHGPQIQLYRFLKERLIVQRNGLHTKHRLYQDRQPA